MKTKALLTAAFLLTGIVASANAASIVGSKHDLTQANAGTISLGGSNQSCIFCHAPHNAVSNKLLWNRTATGVPGSFNIYTSYNRGIMRTALTQDTLSSKSSSLLCLSCHSLATAAEIQTNTNNSAIKAFVNTLDGTATTRWASTTGNMRDLSNDHPVGISYQAAYAADNAALVAPDAATKTVINPNDNTIKLKLFNISDVDSSYSMECASCHSVHDPANGKFLAASNNNSALCITCHKK